MIKHRLFFYFAFTIGLVISAFGQTIPTKMISLDNGLSQSVVKAILQDNNGYLWFGTEYGLNKYDGKKNEAYYKHHGLSSNEITCLQKDAFGTLWIGTSKGLTLRLNDKFVIFEGTDSLLNAPVNTVAFAKDGSVWIGTEGDGIWIYNGDIFDRWNVDNGLSSDSVRSILFLENGAIWIGTRNGINIFNGSGFKIIQDKQGLTDNKVRSLLQIDNQTIWAGTRDGITEFKFDKPLYRVKAYRTTDNLPDNKITNLFLDDQQRVWVTTENGIAVWENNKFEAFGTQNGLEASYFYTTYEDFEGTIWLASYGSGAVQFLGEKFVNWTTDDGLSNSVVSSVFKDSKEKVWIGTYGGGIDLIAKSKKIKNISMKSGHLPDDKIYHIVESIDHKIWVGTRHGIVSLNENLTPANTETIQLLPKLKYRFLLQENDSNWWFATEDEGIFHLEKNQIKQFTVDNGLVSNSTRVLLKHTNGDLFIGTTNGLSILRKGEFLNFTLQNGLVNQVILDMIETDDGSVWFTHYQGISKISLDGQIEHIDFEFRGEPQASYLIREFNGYLWVGTNKGLVQIKLDEKNPHRKLYTSTMGLVNDELNKGSIYIDSENYFWLGTVNGLTRFKPKFIQDKKNRIPLYFEEIEVTGKTIESRKIIELPFKDNYFSISFAALSYIDASTMQYKYRLKGVDIGWQNTYQSKIRYAGLTEGEYEFQVKAIDNNGVESKQISQMIHVLPPFWRSSWFLFLMASIVLSIAYLVLNNIRISKMVETERIRVRIASDLHDDIGASLTEIALQADFIQAMTADEDSKVTLQELAEQSRKVVTTMDDIVWSIDARNDTLGDLTDRIQDYANKMASKKEIIVNYHFTGIQSEKKIHSDLRQNVYLICKEAINNTIKYAQADLISIDLIFENGLYSLLISDNGIGLENLTKKTGHGLKNIKERATRLGGKLSFESKNGLMIQVKGFHL
ncbi:MAG: hypothetical protein GW809_01715 [Bacteroidetes bacterium]|nr:hypothetical protein [Bacteroidota bacterium]NCQ10869.1 hypothetical protein [Bacteroidota bacterium]